MTNEEAIHIMNAIIYMLEPQYDKERVEEAVSMAIKALEQQPSEDCISREEALLALTGMDLPTDRDKLIALFTERIQHLPPVTPRTNLAETSQDCISREYIEPIIEELENICFNGDEYILSLLSNIKNAPPVTPQRPKGKWIYKEYDDRIGIGDSFFCSECGEPRCMKLIKYCPNCGAEMSGGEEDGNSN